MKNIKSSKALQIIMWVLQGMIVGIGAILPGVSGGTLCYAFGIYDYLIEVLTNPIKGIKKHWFMLIFVGLGGCIGFIGFAGITAALLAWNEAVVLCVFVGLIAGTIPELWHDAGEKGRNKFSVISLIVSFLFITLLFYMCQNVWVIRIPETWYGFAICGVIWGLSFIIPGFSSSTLLLFFGIYEAMSRGISTFDFGVLIPLGICMLATLLLLSRVMKAVFEKFSSIASHAVMGFVLATTMMLLLSESIVTSLTPMNIFIYLACIICGGVVGYFFTWLCAKIKQNAEEN